MGEYNEFHTKFVVHLKGINQAKEILAHNYLSGYKHEASLPYESELLRRVQEYLTDWKKEDPIGDKNYKSNENPKISMLEWKLNRYKKEIIEFLRPGENLKALQNKFPEIIQTEKKSEEKQIIHNVKRT